MSFNVINYNLKLEPQKDKLLVLGKEELTLNIEIMTKEIQLNVANIDIKKIEFKEENVVKVLNLFNDEENEIVRINFTDYISGEVTLLIQFVSKITDKSVGFYRTYQNKTDKSKFWIVSHFFSIEARKVFPCFDLPNYKATFDVELIIDENDDAIFNTNIKSEKLIADRKKSIKFFTTPKMSTYLLFFGIGNFDIIQDYLDTIPIRVISEETKASEFGQFALKYGIQFLAYCQEYFNYHYPLEKLDLITVKDFLYGAMENWGSIVFQERRLLYYPNETSQANENSILMTIAHEICHQWFGDLVSPNSWKYLWLNESFATFLGYIVMDKFFPERFFWGNFLSEVKNIALFKDSFQTTVSIELPKEEKMVLNIISRPIVYSKGASVLRQLENFLGFEAFKKGIQVYIEKYAYDSAKSNDLWEVLTQTTNQQIDQIMKSWVNQKGHPIVKCKKIENKLYLRQELFSFSLNNIERNWSIPITIKVYNQDGGFNTINYLLSESKATIDINENISSYVVNFDGIGFYHVRYEDINFKSIIDMIDKLSSTEKWTVENDYFIFLLQGTTQIDNYFNLINRLYTLIDPLVLHSLLNHLETLFYILTNSKAERLNGIANRILNTLIDKIGINSNENEAYEISNLRNKLLSVALLFEIKTVMNFGMQQYQKIKNSEFVDPNLKNFALISGARESSDIEFYFEEYEKTDSEQDKRNYLTAISNITDTLKVNRVLAYIINNIPDYQITQAIELLCRNKIFRSLLWDWFVSNFEYFENLHKLRFEDIIYSIVPRSFEKKDQMRKFFDNYVILHPDFQNVVDLSFETLEIYNRLKNL